MALALGSCPHEAGLMLERVWWLHARIALGKGPSERGWGGLPTSAPWGPGLEGPHSSCYTQVSES